MTTARLVLLCVKLVAAYSSVKVSMWNVRSRRRERGLTCDFQKGLEKIVLERKNESMRSAR